MGTDGVTVLGATASPWGMAGVAVVVDTAGKLLEKLCIVSLPVGTASSFTGKLQLKLSMASVGDVKAGKLLLKVRATPVLALRSSGGVGDGGHRAWLRSTVLHLATALPLTVTCVAFSGTAAAAGS